MNENTLSRRVLLQTTVRLAVVGSAPLLLQGCQEEEFGCEDTSGLKPEEVELRTTLEYRDRSPHGEAKNCANCAFFVVGGKDQCGQCTLVRGPIHPLGYCGSWAMKT
jgi:hypothetical protein